MAGPYYVDSHGSLLGSPGCRCPISPTDKSTAYAFTCPKVEAPRSAPHDELHTATGGSHAVHMGALVSTPSADRRRRHVLRRPGRPGGPRLLSYGSSVHITAAPRSYSLTSRPSSRCAGHRVVAVITDDLQRVEVCPAEPVLRRTRLEVWVKVPDSETSATSSRTWASSKSGASGITSTPSGSTGFATC